MVLETNLRYAFQIRSCAEAFRVHIGWGYASGFPGETMTGTTPSGFKQSCGIG